MTFILLTFFSIFLVSSPVEAKSIFTQEIQNISTRYSRHLDSMWSENGWNYSVPSSQYREIGLNSANNLRMQATFAASYQNRDDEESKAKVRTALINGLIELPKQEANSVIKDGRAVSTRSFHHAIGLYLALNTIQNRSELFSWAERLEMQYNAKQMLPWILKAPDTENRALLGAAYGLAVLQHPLMSVAGQDREEYKGLIRVKVQEGLKSIGRDNVYREGRPKRFSLHYHLVSANMLFSLCKELSDQKYCSIANQMTKVVRKWFSKGKLSWKGSFRPRGIGLQTVLLRALAEQSSGNSRWKEYWDTEKLRRGFIDPRNPNRLVWKDEVDKTLNDDYSFSSMAEFLVLGD